MGSYKYKVSEKFRIVAESDDSIKMALRAQVIFHTEVKIINLKSENMHFRATKVFSDFSVHCSIVAMVKEPFAAVVSPPTVFWGVFLPGLCKFSHFS